MFQSILRCFPLYVYFYVMFILAMRGLQKKTCLKKRKKKLSFNHFEFLKKVVLIKFRMQQKWVSFVASICNTLLLRLSCKFQKLKTKKKNLQGFDTV